MNYPSWIIPSVGGATLIALISVVHVYVAHLAVGGGLFIWLTDRKAVREQDGRIRDYIKRHTWFFLLLTMVFGGLTGVGIWFIIGLVQPAATSTLIHNYVFGWGIEWVFFLGEIVALLIYHYRFDKLAERRRTKIAFFYFLFAWLSLVVINGILAFMLTPGAWLKTKDFWDGFLNPTFLPSMLFRTSITVMIAGLFGYVSAVFIKDNKFRLLMMRYCSRWLLLPLPGLIISGFWYYHSLPEEIRQVTFLLNPDTAIFARIFILGTLILFISGVLLSLRLGRRIQGVLAFVLVAIGLLWMGGFEYVREGARKPFVIRDYMYSSSILKEDVPRLNREGVLKNARWTDVRSVKEDPIRAGRELFRLQCLPCHTIDGPRNDIRPKTAALTRLGLMTQLTGLGVVSPYMPPFVGTRSEKEALADYIYGEIQGREDILERAAERSPRGRAGVEIPSFDRSRDEYLILAWNELGMNYMTDCDPWFVILPPANTLEAQLIKRGETPEVVTEGVDILFQAEDGFENPSGHVPFWKYAEVNFGVKLTDNVGLKGLGMSGKMISREDGLGFTAPMIPLVPYDNDGGMNPYPLFSLTARERDSGKILATTFVVAPISTEWGCRNCHGGDWRWGGVTGISDETARNILRAHDRRHDTRLLNDARAGEPRVCSSCHADPALAAEGKPDLLNLSAAIHGFHAHIMPATGAAACRFCHPADPRGVTRYHRGVHSRLGLTCVNCHGQMRDHALALLKGEVGKRGERWLSQHLIPSDAADAGEVAPRKPWLNEPDCLNCHEDFSQPIPGFTGFNRWTENASGLFRNRTGEEEKVRCAACHHSTHAVYPALNPFHPQRDAIQPLQYGGRPYPLGTGGSCWICHTVDMEMSIHHENMEREARFQVEEH